MTLLACPFCRELFPSGADERCPECGVVLESFHRVAEYADDIDGELPIPDEERHVRWSSPKHGRGPLLVAPVVGLVTFFLPWISIAYPVSLHMSGFDLARRLGWPWAIAAAWLVLLPTVLTRRSLRRMRSARLAVLMLSVIPGISSAILWANPPRWLAGIPVQVALHWPLHLGVALSLVGVVGSLLFGHLRPGDTVRRR